MVQLDFVIFKYPEFDPALRSEYLELELDKIVSIQNSPNSILTGSAINHEGQKKLLRGLYLVDFAIEGHSSKCKNSMHSFNSAMDV